MTHMYWSALHRIVELHLSRCHREKHTKNFWWCAAVSCCFCRLRLIGRVMSAEVDTCWCKTHRGDTMYGGSINRTWWPLMKAELGLRIQLAVQCFLASILHWSLLPWKRHSRELFPGVSAGPGPSCWLMLRLRPGCLCNVVPLLLILVCYPDSTEPDCLGIHDKSASGLICHC